MGFFSWKCAKSGVEITSFHTGTPDWTQRIVLLRKDRPPEFGVYDGYGRLCTDEGDVIDFWVELQDAQPGVRYDNLEQPRLVLARLYRGENYEDVVPSRYGEWQGYFLPEDYERQAELLAKACELRVQHTPNPRTFPFVVTVEQIAKDEDLDCDDREVDPAGAYEFMAAHTEDALEQLHSQIPISCLEDFLITAVYQEGPTV